VEIDHLETDEVVQNVEDWLSTAETPEPQATEAREMLERDVEEDLSGDSSVLARRRTLL